MEWTAIVRKTMSASISLPPDASPNPGINPLPYRSSTGGNKGKLLTGFLRLLTTLLLSAGCQAADVPAFGFQDFLLVPVRVHLLSSAETPELHTTLTGADVERIFQKANRVWSPAGIQFFVESLVAEPALETKKLPEPDTTKRAPAGLGVMLEHMPQATRCAEAFNVYYVKSFDVNGVYFGKPEAIFVKDTASLRKVEGGIDEPLPRVTSHELGHAFSLAHRQDTFNLMASGTTGTSLNESEIRQARESAAKRPWIQSAKAWHEKATALDTGGKAAEALAAYKKLAALPLEAAPEVQAARSKIQAEAK